jgi:hypothetical protein
LQHHPLLRARVAAAKFSRKATVPLGLTQK